MSCGGVEISIPDGLLGCHVVPELLHVIPNVFWRRQNVCIVERLQRIARTSSTATFALFGAVILDGYFGCAVGVFATETRFIYPNPAISNRRVAALILLLTWPSVPLISFES